jgi:hypothetical protein
VFRRGELTPLNVHDWQMLSKGDAAASFMFLAPGEVSVAACNVPTPASSVQGCDSH